MPLGVLLVDDHALIREGLRRAFEQTDDLEVVAEAASAHEALARVRASAPDVAVVDVRLGGSSGVDLVRELRADHAAMGLVVLTMHDDDAHLFAALDAGASAFVLKTAPAEEVVAAARAAAAAPSAFLAQDLAGAMRRRMSQRTPTLTEREDEVLQLLAAGLSVSEVAGRLYISASTAKTHIARLYEKLGATTRTQAVMAGVRLGLVDTDVRAGDEGLARG